MPLLIMTGYPSSGKSTRTRQLQMYFESKLQKKVFIVSETNIIASKGDNKNSVFNSSSKEKDLRGIIKSETLRFIGKEDLVIIDAGNYIKGFRYELYCASKSSGTTQCTVHCATPVNTAWQWTMASEEPYSKEVFDALVMRYEPPDSRNRWDSPLFTVNPEDCLPLDDIRSALYERKAPPPNMSTQCAPLSSTNFLYELDKVTQEIVGVILAAHKLGAEGEVKVPGYKDSVTISDGSRVSAPQLTRLRRQFLAYSKLHPSNDISKIGPLFIQFLNSSLV